MEHLKTGTTDAVSGEASRFYDTHYRRRPTASGRARAIGRRKAAGERPDRFCCRVRRRPYPVALRRSRGSCYGRADQACGAARLPAIATPYRVAFERRISAPAICGVLALIVVHRGRRVRRRRFLVVAGAASRCRCRRRWYLAAAHRHRAGSRDRRRRASAALADIGVDTMSSNSKELGDPRRKVTCPS